MALSLLAAASLGFALAKLRTEFVAAPVLAHRIGPIGLEGRVEQSELHGKGIRIVSASCARDKLEPGATPARVRISVRAATTLPQPGSWVHVTAVLHAAASAGAPGAYDFGRAPISCDWAQWVMPMAARIPIQAAGEPSLRDRMSLLVESLRARMTERIHSVLPGSTGAIASALITGNRGAHL